jgi:intracellular multiplication protein IcmB
MAQEMVVEYQRYELEQNMKKKLLNQRKSEAVSS